MSGFKGKRSKRLLARAQRRAEELFAEELSGEVVDVFETDGEAIPEIETDVDVAAEVEPTADAVTETSPGSEAESDTAAEAESVTEFALSAEAEPATESESTIKEFVFPGRVVRAKHTEPTDDRSVRAERIQGERGWFGVFDRAALPVSIFFLELVLKASTTGDFFPSIIYIALFSVAWGELFRLISMLGEKRKDGRRIRAAMLVVLGVVFAANYFLYRQFKVFYDLKTSFLGAVDAATGFTGTIWELISSPTGIAHIIAFLMPAILYGAVCLVKGKLSREERQNPRLGRIAAGVYVSHLIVILLIQFSPVQFATYWSRYNFQAAVPNFGLLTSIRKDIQSIWFPSNEELFSPVNTASGSTESSKKSAKGKNKAAGRNEMDIDFSDLAKNSSEQFAQMDAYVASLTPSSKNDMTGTFKGYNLIFISAEAFSAEAIREDITPTLYRMANKGIQFTDYYQFDTAGTTGGECANIFGMLATEGGDSVKGTSSYNNYLTIGNALNREGYNGWAFHNNTYTFYGRDTTHNNLGYNNGYMGYGNGMEEYVTWQWPQSDLEMIQGTFDNIYGDAEPFNVYYMSVSGHSGYSTSENSMSAKYWDEVADLDYSDPVKAYLACNIDLDRAMEYLIEQLEEKNIADHTLIVISADHFPYGLDDDAPLGQLPNTSELYGFEINDYFQRDHNRLIMWSGSLEHDDPIVVDEPVFSVDILPTLLNLFGVEWDSRLLPGRDVFSDAEPLVFDLSYDWKTDLGTYYASSAKFVPASDEIEIPKDYVETHNAIVQNKITYMRGVLQNDYFRHVYGDAGNVQEIHDKAAASNNKPQSILEIAQEALDTLERREARKQESSKDVKSSE